MTDGSSPATSLIADAAGDLFGTTLVGGTSNHGTVFEIPLTASGYAMTPVTLLNVLSVTGNQPEATLAVDQAGNLFGTTLFGGTGFGNVFEIPKTATGYATTAIDLSNFSVASENGPYGQLVLDANGDLFGTTAAGGSGNDGTIYELANSATGYAATPTVLASFTGPNGSDPVAGLIADAAGNLFGTASGGGPAGSGVVFELAKTATGYATAPTVLASFNYVDGSLPMGRLLLDSAGDLFGTTEMGPSGGDGTVFEIADTAAGYATTPITLATFNGTNGYDPVAGLIFDANGNLLGTTNGGGVNNGTVFEVVKPAGGFGVGAPTAPLVLTTFPGMAGAAPSGDLLLLGGNVFGTTNGGGTFNDGAVFEFPACYVCGTLITTEAGEVAVERLAIGDMILTASGELRPVKWIGRRAYAGRFLRANPRVCPIRFRAGCLGGGLPRRDLLVSPEHAMVLDGFLVPARQLVDGVAIAVDRTLDVVEYIHVELDTHDALLAEGAPSETFIDDDSRNAFHNAREFHALYPGHTEAGRGFAPRLEEGFELEAIRARLSRTGAREPAALAG